jgi:hypothetical protein
VGVEEEEGTLVGGSSCPSSVGGGTAGALPVPHRPAARQ